MKTTWVQRNISPFASWAFAKAGFVDRRILAQRVRALASQLDAKAKQQLWFALAAQPYEVKLRNLFTPKKLVDDDALSRPLEEIRGFDFALRSTIKRLTLIETRFRAYTGRDDFYHFVIAPVTEQALFEETGPLDPVFARPMINATHSFEAQKPLILMDLGMDKEGESLSDLKVIEQVCGFAKRFSGLSEEDITYRIQKMADIGGDAKTIIACLFMHMQPLDINGAFQAIAGLPEFSELPDYRENVCGLIAVARELFENFKFDKMQLLKDRKQIFRKMCQLFRKTGNLQALHIFLMMKLFYARQATPEVDGIFNEIRFILAPLAERIGLIYLADDFRDQYLRLTDPDKYELILQKIKEKTGKEYEFLKIYLEMYTKEVLRYLKERGIDTANIVIKHRVKSPYSLFEKIFCRKQGHTFENIRDILGLKILCNSKKEAELITYILTKQEVFTAYKDGYKNELEAKGDKIWQGIKLVGETIALEPSLPIEIQIMTKDMNKANNHGKAAHWWYKLLEEIKSFAREMDADYVEQIFDRQEKQVDMTGDPLSDFEEILNFWTIDPDRIGD